MRDFCASTDRDCIRLIVAQDLKESGIDVDSQCANTTINNVNGSNINNSNNNNNKNNNDKNNHYNHHHHHHLVNAVHHHHQLVSNNSTNNQANTSTHHVHSNSNDDTNNKSTRVFGVTLRQLEMVNITLNEQVLSVPSFLRYAFDYIREYTNIEGIFRRNGTASRLKELKKQVEEGLYNFSQFAIFDITSLIKLFFREMPESLLTFTLYTNFIKAVKMDSAKSKIDTILNLCLQLPDINLHVLIYLMNFLKLITLQESSNKMNSFNLAVCFAPNLIYTRINKHSDLYINEERIVVQYLIENCNMIGKISDSVYERSMMLNSLCCSTTMMQTSSNTSGNITNGNFMFHIKVMRGGGT
jgi:hypothetical protein